MSRKTLLIIVVVAVALIAVIVGVSYFSSQQNQKLNSQTASALTQDMTDAQKQQFSSYDNAEFNDQAKALDQSIFK